MASQLARYPTSSASLLWKERDVATVVRAAAALSSSPRPRRAVAHCPRSPVRSASFGDSRYREQMAAEGWYHDPYGRHEARWISDGRATDLVRDGHQVSHDVAPSEPFKKPLEPWDMDTPERPGEDVRLADSEKLRQSPWGVGVPGGFVTTERCGGFAFLASVLRYSARGFEQDIVVKDGPFGRELYREGPFNNISVGRPFKRIVEEIERVGLESFLRRVRIENAQLGPVNAPSGRFTFPLMAYFNTWVRTLGGRRKVHPDE